MKGLRGKRGGLEGFGIVLKSGIYCVEMYHNASSTPKVSIHNVYDFPPCIIFLPAGQGREARPRKRANPRIASIRAEYGALQGMP